MSDAGAANNPFGDSPSGPAPPSASSGARMSPALGSLAAKSSPAGGRSVDPSAAAAHAAAALRPMKAAAPGTGNGIPVARAAATSLPAPASSRPAAPQPTPVSGPAPPAPVLSPMYIPPPDVDIAFDESRAQAAGLGMDSLLRGEVPIFKDVECYFKFHVTRLLGTLSATSYRVVFTPGGGASSNLQMPLGMRHVPRSFFCLPVGLIRRIEKTTPRDRGREGGPASFALDISSKDARVWSVGMRDEETTERIADCLRRVAFPPKPDFLSAFEGGPSLSAPAPISAATATSTWQAGWDVYNPYRELERIGVLSLKHPRSGEHLWRVSDINREYDFAPTYPSVLIFPERMPDAALKPVGHFRSKARVPALTWMHPVNKTTMWRCSQPRVGLAGNTCKEDEALCAAIRDANIFSRDPTAPLLIADCRPRANAMANMAGGWGYENYTFGQLEFLGIHNIHEVREAQRKMEALALSSTPHDVNWSSAVAETRWPYHLRSVLSASIFVADCMHRRGQSVVVHCSDGWDRTAQVCGLVQIMLDPFFRTLRGLCVLIAKEWAAFGHKFHERAGHAMEKHDDSDISPVFIQFLDALWQLVRRFPTAFEYNSQALLLLAHHLYSCRFGTFLFNCERERVTADLMRRTPSLWAYMLSEEVAPALMNPLYDPAAGDVLIPHPSSVLRNIDVWDAWFMRWSPFPSFTACCTRMDRYPNASYDHTRVADARWTPERALAPGRAPPPARAATTTAGATSAAAAAGHSEAAGTGAAAAPYDAPSSRADVDPLMGVALSAPIPVHAHGDAGEASPALASAMERDTAAADAVIQSSPIEDDAALVDAVNGGVDMLQDNGVVTVDDGYLSAAAFLPGDDDAAAMTTQADTLPSADD